MGSSVRRIVVVAQDRTDIGYGVFLARALRKLGHLVDEYAMLAHRHDHRPIVLAARKLGRMAGLERKVFNRACEELVSRLRATPADVVLFVKCNKVSQDVLRRIRESGAAVVHTNPDHPARDPGLKDTLYLNALPEYDLVVTFARPLVPVYYQMGARRVLRLPFAHDPEVHRPVVLDPSVKIVFECPVAFLGAWGPFQQEWLSPLVQEGLRVFGGLWHRLPLGHPLRPCVSLDRGWGAEMAKVCAGATVVVNMIRAEHGCFHSMKTFEIPACGGFMLSDRTDEQLEFFRDGHEAAYFDSREEMVDKVRYYLSHEMERESIRESGTLVAQGHSYESRARTLLSML